MRLVEARGKVRGGSLLEVLIAMGIMALGVTMVIALFPIGVERTRQAVYDTRATIMARDAEALNQARRFYNDPRLLRWDEVVSQKAIGSSKSWEKKSAKAKANATGRSEQIFDYEQANKYAYALDAVTSITDGQKWDSPSAPTAPTTKFQFDNDRYLTGSNTATPKQSVPPTMADEGDTEQVNNGQSGATSFPILIDPILYEAQARRAELDSSLGFPPRLGVASAYYQGVLGLGAASPYFDIRVETLAEIEGTGQPGEPAAGPDFEFEYTYTDPGPPPTPTTEKEKVETIHGIHAPAYTENDPTTDSPPPTYVMLRNGYITRWFASPADVLYSKNNAVIPQNPLGKQSKKESILEHVRLNVDPAGTFPDQVKPTVARNYIYSWAIMLQRDLAPDPDQPASPDPTNPPVGRPSNLTFSGKVRYLCFHKRDLNNPFQIVEGCFYEGSNRVTLAWPTTVSKPNIKRGSWILEATIARDNVNSAGNRHTGRYPNDSRSNGPTPNNFLHYRRDFNFYRVNAVSDPVAASGRFLQVVEVSPTPTGYPTTHPQGDQRAPDAYFAPEWPIVDDGVLGGVGMQTSTQGPIVMPATEFIAVFYPVIVFDGLIEVYPVKD